MQLRLLQLDLALAVRLHELRRVVQKIFPRDHLRIVRVEDVEAAPPQRRERRVAQQCSNGRGSFSRAAADAPGLAPCLSAEQQRTSRVRLPAHAQAVERLLAELPIEIVVEKLSDKFGGCLEVLISAALSTGARLTRQAGTGGGLREAYASGWHGLWAVGSSRVGAPPWCDLALCCQALLERDTIEE